MADLADIITAIAATYEAADGDSNDEEIEALQECRDILESLVGERTLMVTPTPLDEGSMYGLREQFATAEYHGAKIAFTHGFGFGSVTITMEAELPGDRRIDESIRLNDLMQQWVHGAIAARFPLKEGDD